jgi:hypothetical protein
LDLGIEARLLRHCMTLGHFWVLGWNGGREKLEWPDEPLGLKTDFEISLYLKLLTGVFVAGIGSETLNNSPLEESLDKWTRPSGHSSFIEWRRGGWTLFILEGWLKSLVDAAIRAAVSPNALYRPRKSI